MRPDRIQVPGPDVWCGLLPAPRRLWLQVGGPCIRSGLWRVCLALARWRAPRGRRGLTVGSGSRGCPLLHAGLLCIHLLPSGADRVPCWCLTSEDCPFVVAAVFLPFHFFPQLSYFFWHPLSPSCSCSDTETPWATQPLTVPPQGREAGGCTERRGLGCSPVSCSRHLLSTDPRQELMGSSTELGGWPGPRGASALQASGRGASFT